MIYIPLSKFDYENGTGYLSVNNKNEAYIYLDTIEGYNDASNTKKIADNVVNAWYCEEGQVPGNNFIVFLKKDGTVTYVRFRTDSDKTVFEASEKIITGVENITNIIKIEGGDENGIGGFKEIVFMVIGTGAYSKLKYESGVHRVQRIPSTESGGRIHTSTATVAIMPEVEDVEVFVDPNDCKIDVYRASGNGGQCVNTTDSAVRITHIPTGIVVTCQDEKSQLKNKDKAMRVLRSRIYDMEQEKAMSEQAAERRSQVGTGDRSEKIRTYNFPQGRVTDHRIKFTSHRLNEILEGDLSELLQNIIAADQTAKLAKLNEAD